jgi:hypothetical protein
MLSSNSLTAFSSATTTSGLKGSNNVRLVRDPVQPVPQATAPSLKSAIPNTMPGMAPPRGSLLNLSV